jgi:NAD-dependent deacetylase
MDTALASLLKPLSQAREVVIFTGAGLSVDSDIPPFRDGATGLWANVDPDEVVSLIGFESNPDRVWAWHEGMRNLFSGVCPNSGHTAIATLEWLLPRARVSVITQNIDGLHQAAGSDRVYEIHGSALRIRCHQHCGFVEDWSACQLAPRRCPSCGAPTRPDVV